MVSPRSILYEVISGLLSGLKYYIVYGVVFPILIKYVVGVEVELPSVTETLVIIGIFTALGIASRVLKPFIGIVFNAISTVLAMLILIEATSTGVLERSITTGGSTGYVSIDMSIFLLVIVGLTAVSSIISFFGAIIRSNT